MLTEPSARGNSRTLAFAPLRATLAILASRLFVSPAGILAPVTELSLIERIRARAARLPRGAVRVGIGDDCAVLRPKPGEEIVVTTDFSLETRHFTRDRHSPESIGHRALARGLSDLAAMGAKPLAAFLSLALPRDIASNTKWLDAFLDGLLTLAAESNVPLAGGDTSESPSPHILADILLVGSVPTGTALLRSTARPGDALYVTGALGGAAAELAEVLNGKRARKATAHPHLFPEPRLAIGELLRRRKLATACLDLSDGLSTDLAHLCTASNVAAELELTALPLHALTAKRPNAQALALHGGEDYELLFTAKPTTTIPRKIAGVAITRIGTILKPKRNQPQIQAIAPDGTRSTLNPAGWEHLA